MQSWRSCVGRWSESEYLTSGSGFRARGAGNSEVQEVEIRAQGAPQGAGLRETIGRDLLTSNRALGRGQKEKVCDQIQDPRDPQNGRRWRFVAQSGAAWRGRRDGRNILEGRLKPTP